MLLLNVVVFAVAGAFGMAFLLQTLHRLSLIPPDMPSVSKANLDDAEDPVELTPLPSRAGAPGRTPIALEAPDERALSKHVKSVFRCWILLYGLVGAQMGWVLRPFVGRPGLEFSWFRPRESNVFQGIVECPGEPLL